MSISRRLFGKQILIGSLVPSVPLLPKPKISKEQEIFNTVWFHLKNQNMPCLNEKKYCAYRNGKMKCAIGALIPDELYDPIIENYCRIQHSGLSSPKAKGYTTLMSILRQIGIETETQFNLCERLQSIHDNIPSFEYDHCWSIWKSKLIETANDFNLDLPE